MSRELIPVEGLPNVGHANSGAHLNSVPPTAAAYGELIGAFRALNESLFDGMLIYPLFVLARKKGRLGHFSPDRFECDSGEHAHEIALYPSCFEALGPRATLGVLAHELTHQWRHDFGALNRKGSRGARGYHDLVWHAKMVELGLPPVYARTPSGTLNKYRVSNTIASGGRFDIAATRLLESGFSFTWHDAPPQLRVRAERDAGQTTQGRRLRYDCSACNTKAWAKSGIRLICGHCYRPMTAYLPAPPEGGRE